MINKNAYTLLIVGVLTLGVCGCANENSTVTTEETEAMVDNEEYTVEENEIMESEEVDTPISDLTVEEVLESYQTAIDNNDYEIAGSTLYEWLKLNDSEEVNDKLEYVKSKVYGSKYSYSMHDETNDYDEKSEYKFDENGNLIEETLGIGTAEQVTYNYQLVFEGDKVVSETCYNDDGDIQYNWEATLDENGNIIREETTYNNFTTGDTTEHIYNEDGLCIEEISTYNGEEDVAYTQSAKFEYNDDKLMVSETWYDESSEPFEIIKYEYDDNHNIIREEYYEDGEEPISVTEYEYNSKGQEIKHTTTQDDHYEYYELTYDKFGNNTSCKFYQHDELISESTYEYDFLNNVVLERTKSTDGDITIIYDYEYTVRE